MDGYNEVFISLVSTHIEISEPDTYRINDKDGVMVWQGKWDDLISDLWILKKLRDTAAEFDRRMAEK